LISCRLSTQLLAGFFFRLAGGTGRIGIWPSERPALRMDAAHRRAYAIPANCGLKSSAALILFTASTMLLVCCKSRRPCQGNQTRPAGCAGAATHQKS
jgi:hypothetical protein